MRKLTLSLGLIAISLASCTESGAKRAETLESSKGTGQIVQANISPGNTSLVNTSSASVRESGADTRRFRRGSYLASPEMSEEQSAINVGNNTGVRRDLVGKYGEERIAKAALLRSWAQIPIVPIGVDAFLRTAWTDNFMHIRVAMLGPQQNLTRFVSTHNQFKLAFTDNSGFIIRDFIIPVHEFKKAADSVNFGTPTYEFESDVEIPLEIYESFYQWTLEWQ